MRNTFSKSPFSIPGVNSDPGKKKWKPRNAFHIATTTFTETFPKTNFAIAAKLSNFGGQGFKVGLCEQSKIHCTAKKCLSKSNVLYILKYYFTKVEVICLKMAIVVHLIVGERGAQWTVEHIG